MKGRKPTNLPASIRQRLLNLARATARPLQEVVQFYAMERFLYRLSVSPHADKFTLKGALMMATWGASSTRPTRDIDLLGRLPNGVEQLVDILREVCLQRVDPDGVDFDATRLAGTTIRKGADYRGVRIVFPASLQNMPIPMQVDIAFGDVVFPRASPTAYPILLDHASFSLRGYSRESAIAEKFETMVKLGLVNSRMKDFFDIWLLSKRFAFKGADLAGAIQRTFSNRGTVITPHPTALSTEFAADRAKATQWQGFRNRLRSDEAPPGLATLCADLTGFLSPPAAAAQAGRAFSCVWDEKGLWTPEPAPND